jgi:tetratricopeptide (TPR) repeat protein
MRGLCKVLSLSVLCAVVGMGIMGCSGKARMFTSGTVTEPAKSEQSVSDSSKSSAVDAAVSASGMQGQLEQTRADYRRILEVMRTWYLDHGLHDKATWAKRELSDFNKIRTHFYKNSKGFEKRLGSFDESTSSSLQAIDMKSLSEPDMIEQLIQIRTSYQSILDEMKQNFAASGQKKEAEWAAQEREDLKRVRFYPYLVVVDIQDTDLSPQDSIVEADHMYEKARKLHEGAKFLPFMNNKRQLKEALDLYVQIIKQYPTSDKIDDAAFYAGEISKEYFNDDVQAVKYYEMAIKWDPKTPHPARFQAAVIYDFRMHNRSKAMSLYQEVLQKEPDIDVTNYRFAARRLSELLKENAVLDESEGSSESPIMKEIK